MKIHRLEVYLDQVLAFADLEAAKEQQVRDEISDHLLTRIEELEEAGATRDDAVFRAIHDYGKPSIVGYRLRSRFPWVDVRTQGTARGFIAVGPKARGCIACGFVAQGIVSAGLLSIGVCSIGVFSLGGLLAIGILSCGGISLGWQCWGLIAQGFYSTGILAGGFYAHGYWCMPQTVHASAFAISQPTWARQLGSTFGWTLQDAVIILGPLHWLFGILLLYAIRIWKRERHRLEQRDLKTWTFD